MKLAKNILLLSVIFMLLIPITQVRAFKNGSYGYNKTDYSYEDSYGTHDWIAEAALDALVEEDADSWNWLNEEDKKVIFLLGTEAPDNSKLETNLDGTLTEGFGDTSKHHVYTDDDGDVLNNEDDSALRAKSCADLADVALNEDNKPETAAFYLGAMTHYIADLAMYAHVAENYEDPYNINFDEHHNTIEGYIQTRTNDYEDREEFFKIDDIDEIETEDKPYDLAVDLAFETYMDGGDTHNAKWLHDNHFTNWADSEDDRDDESDTRQDYYDRIEECLNNAIEACASAMAYVGGLEDSLPGYSVPLMLVVMGISIFAVVLIVLKRRK